MVNALPLGHRKLVNPPPYPGGGTLGDSLDTSIIDRPLDKIELKHVRLAMGTLYDLFRVEYGKFWSCHAHTAFDGLALAPLSSREPLTEHRARRVLFVAPCEVEHVVRASFAHKKPLWTARTSICMFL